MAKFICFECGSNDEYELRKAKREYEGEDYYFEMEVELPYCKKCGALVYVDEIEDKITAVANEKIRSLRNIISIPEINEILEQYNVSQKYLSKILGWGEVTLARYVSGGYTPSRENSDLLKSIKDPYFMKKVLVERVHENERIFEERSFVKLNDRVNEVILDNTKKCGKIFHVVNWFLKQSTYDMPMTHLALQKLLYYAQNWNMVFNNEWLFENDCEAWVHGAVYREVYNQFKSFKYNPLPTVECKVDLLENEIAVLEFVKKYYFDVFASKVLEKICHLEDPYIIARRGCEEKENSTNIIKKSDMEQYYRLFAYKYNITKDSMRNVQLYLNNLLLVESN